MNNYLIAAIATVGIALSSGAAFACQKQTSASAQSERAPDSQQTVVPPKAGEKAS